MSISVGSGSPKPPVYACHARDGDAERARRFGAAAGRTFAFDPDSDDPRRQDVARHIVRHAERRPVWQAGLARLDYIGAAGAPPGTHRMELIHLPRGVAVRGYEQPVEDAYFVLDGALTVGWEQDGETVEDRLGPERCDSRTRPAARGGSATTGAPTRPSCWSPAAACDRTSASSRHEERRARPNSCRDLTLQ